ncbi:MAG: 30S ribosomal protein S15 [Bacteroidota bacterium]|nr:30S ribosomal protein S15 [Bacteroidota bacterium]
MKLSSEDKKSVFKEYGKDITDSGSVFSQVALFTKRIQHLTEHLSNNKKDYKTQRSLQLIVGRRRKLLDYLKNKDIVEYRKLIEKLKLRK